MSLKRKSLIHEDNIASEHRYRFKHAIIQQAAYESLKSDKQKEIHDKAAAAIESAFPDRLEDFYETLAYHYTRAQNWVKACCFLQLSAQIAIRNDNTAEALDFLSRAIQVLDCLPHTQQNLKSKLEAMWRQAVIFVLTGYPENIQDHLREMDQLADELKDPRSAALANVIYSIYYIHNRDRHLALKYAEIGYKQAQMAQDVELIAVQAATLCNVYALAGKFDSAVNHGMETIRLLEKRGKTRDFFGTAINVYSWLCAFVVISLSIMGRFEEGIVCCEKAVANAVSIEHIATLGVCRLAFGFLAVLRTDGNSAVEYAKSAMTHLEQLKWDWLWPIANTLSGAGYYFKGDLDQALELLEMANRKQTELGPAFLFNLPCIFLGMVNADLGDFLKAQQYAETALNASREFEDIVAEALSIGVLGWVLARTEMPPMERTKEYLLEAELRFREIRANSFLITSPISLVTLFLNTHEMKEVENHFDSLREALVQLKAMRIPFWLTLAKQVFARAEALVG